jgi:acetyltransferase EpsM
MYLYGASGHSKVIIDIIQSSTTKVIEGVFDDNPHIKSILNIPVLKFNKEVFDDENELIIGIGNNKTRKELAAFINAKYQTIIHSSAVVSRYAKILEGTVVMPNAVINANAKIGKHCIINSRAVIEHDCQLDDFVHVSPNASLAGNVIVGEGSHIGIGAQVIQGVSIGKWVTVGAGAIVLKDVLDGVTVVGNPAKVLKR